MAREEEITKVPPKTVHHPSEVIGEWGPFQRRVFIFLTVVYLIAPIQNLNSVFTAPKTNFVCRDNYGENVCYVGRDNKTKCSAFDYDRNVFRRTLVTEFDLVCDRMWLGSAIQSVYQLGYMVSGVVLGVLSDRYGRVFCARIAILLEVIAGFGQAFAPSIYHYMVARFFVAVAAYGRFLTGYVLIAEWVGPKIRGKMAIVHEQAWALGKILMPIIYWTVPDYVYVQIGLSSTEFVLLVIYLFIVKESPKYLLSKGRYEEAEDTLTKAATAKGRLPESEIKERIEALKEFSKQENAKMDSSGKGTSFVTPILDTWRDPKLLKVSIILYYAWFAIAFTNYAIIFNSGNLGGNLFVNFFILGLSDWISCGVNYYIIPRYERKTIMTSTVILTAVGLFATFACSFHDSLVVLRITFSMLSSMTAGLSFQTLYITTTETYPTMTRQVQIGVCATFGRIGSTIAPFINDLTRVTHLSVSLGVICVMSITNAISLSFLPDTTDIQLPDTIIQIKDVVEEDIEKRKRRKSSFGISGTDRTPRPSITG